MNRRNRIALGIGSTLVLGAAGAGIASGSQDRQHARRPEAAEGRPVRRRSPPTSA